jgi:aspartate aminotransferase-like enzyme
MFNPNYKPHFSHRGMSYQHLQAETAHAFRRIAGLDKDWDVLFLTGSGTLGLEAVIASSTRMLSSFYSHPEAKFAQRISDMLRAYKKTSVLNSDIIYPQYETSLSMFNPAPNRRIALANNFTIADSISSFPYYGRPESVDVFVTVSGKQLLGSPGIAIVCVHKRAWDLGLFMRKSTQVSYLNVALWKAAADSTNETPFTPAITVLQDLQKSLLCFDVSAQRKRIQERYSALCEVVGENPDQSPPVFSFKGVLKGPKFKERNLYGRQCSQLFLWSSTDEAFDDLLTDLKEASDEDIGSCFWRT